MVMVQLCLSQPFSGTSGREAEDVVADQNAEGEDDERRDNAGQSTGKNNSPSRIPKLRNGDLNICFLNAAFVAFLKIFPDAIQLQTTEERSEVQLIKAMKTVLSSSPDDGTTLVDVRRVLHHYNPSSYEDKPDGGFAVSTLEDLLKAFSRETGKNRTKCSMVITEKQDDPSFHCEGEPRSFCRRVPVTTLNLSVTPADDDEGPSDLQWYIDCYRENMAQSTETIECGTCGINFDAAAVSQYEVMPEVFLVEFNGAPRSILDVEAAIRWGDLTYRIVAMIHHGNNHYWVSVREGKGSTNAFVIVIGIDRTSNMIKYLCRLDQI